ncbi:hypothetical protein AVEN_132696-1 [Araneus ventricosus]|uniref:Uncharacterized protein n=1 Tax=Araneus ventricosus TaxID=182803 RepID=A0A4Y2AVR8_ARAVE|nr:hypothetical protein AVEN_132696-1 [Araneus ventricosus]
MFPHACMMLKSYRIFSTKLMHYISIPARESRLPIQLTICFSPPPPIMTSKPRSHAPSSSSYLYRKREAILNPELYQSDILYHVDILRISRPKRNATEAITYLYHSSPRTDTEYLILLVCII